MKKALCIILLISSQSSHGDPVAFYGIVPNMSIIQIEIEDMQSLKFSYLIKSQLDSSGACASLATILNFMFLYPIREEDIFSSIQKPNASRISLQDLADVLEQHRFKGIGVQLKPEQLERLKFPGVILLNEPFGHFVVLKSVHQGQVFIADPVLGNRKISKEMLLQHWNTVILLVTGRPLKPVKPFLIAQNTGFNEKTLGTLPDYYELMEFGFRHAEFLYF